jgi:hypothetical protein
MNDYCNGIAYATGCFANENGKRYLVVRNLDPWYAKNIESETGYKAYESKHNIERDGRSQWNVKARNIDRIPEFSELENINDFCRAYVEIHGMMDLMTAKDRKGNHFKKPRLRIFGTEEVLMFLNKQFPSAEKKIQYISNITENIYIGRTCALYYQSAKEMHNILEWLDGMPKNERIWKKWKEIIEI